MRQMFPTLFLPLAIRGKHLKTGICAKSHLTVRIRDTLRTGCEVRK